MKKYFLYMTIFTLLISIILPSSLRSEEHIEDENQDILESIGHFAEILAYIQQQHLEGKDNEKLVEGAIKGMLRELDPYSQYIPDQIKFSTQNRGNYGGLGMMVGMRDDMITVISPFEGNPAALAGVQNGDIISQIDGESTAVMSLDDAVNLLRGEPGTQVTITLIRPKVTRPIEVTITREVIRTPSVKHEIVGDNIGYIKISQFLQTTANDVDKVLDDFVEQGVNGVILDLRLNPGGLLSSAVDIASDFLEEGQLVVYSQGLGEPEEFRAEGIKREKFPLIVLVDSGSASASEIVAGAIKDHRRGIVMGKQTFGKASVQKVFQLNDSKAAIKLTVASYYTPNDVNIDKIGITPDVEVSGFSRSERLMQNKVYEHAKLKNFIEEFGDDVLQKLNAAEHASRDEQQTSKILQAYRRLTEELSDAQIILSDIGLKYSIALLTENLKDNLEHHPQVLAAIEQMKVLRLLDVQN